MILDFFRWFKLAHFWDELPVFSVKDDEISTSVNSF